MWSVWWHKYLGRGISAEGIRPCDLKLEALLKVPSPTTVKQVRQFMGLVGYFRKFIPNFATRTFSITKFVKNNEPFSWTEVPIVQTITVSIWYYATNWASHGCKFDRLWNGIATKMWWKSRVIGYFSKRVSQAETRYHSYELETFLLS